MGTGFIATVGALMAFAFVEGFAAQYPSRQTWYRLRRARGREATRKMRERFEAAAARKTPRWIALVLLAMVGVWAFVASSWFAKDWQAIVLDSLSSMIVAFALLRVPHALRSVAERMKDLERRAGEDPDQELDGGDGGPAVVAL